MTIRIGTAALIALVAGVAACSAPAELRLPTSEGGQAENVVVPPMGEVPPPPDLHEAPPAVIADAPDEASRLFACMEYSHVSLLVETDKRDQDAVVARLGELRGGKDVCFPLVGRILKGYGPAVGAFEAEWSFYLAYFALTAEAFTDHNAQTFCRHLGQTVKASKAAVHSARAYLKWLSGELAASDQSANPTIRRMSEAATEKVTGLTVASSELRAQYWSECK